MTKTNRRIGYCLTFVSIFAFAVAEVSAQRRGGGGGGGGNRQVRSSSSGSIQGASRGNVNRSTASASNRNVNRSNVNRSNVNTANRSGNRVNTGNINTGDVNIDVDNNNGWGGYARPLAVGAVAAVTTAAVVGSYYNTLPGGCAVVMRGAVTYHQCGSAWYQPVYSGSSVQYQVVSQPY